MGGSGISWTICKSFAPYSRQITTPVPHHSIFYGPDALLDAQPTVSKAQSNKGSLQTSYKVLIMTTFDQYVGDYYVNS